jgi:hypothetical protein
VDNFYRKQRITIYLSIMGNTFEVFKILQGHNQLQTLIRPHYVSSVKFGRNSFIKSAPAGSQVHERRKRPKKMDALVKDSYQSDPEEHDCHQNRQKKL